MNEDSDLERLIIRDQTILDAHAKGVGIEALSILTGLDVESIFQLVQDAGVHSLQPSPIAPVTEVVLTVDAPTAEPVVRCASRRNRNETICNLYRAGTKAKMIGLLYGITTAAVYGVLARYGVQTRKAAP